ncbi:hypothetical protein SNEBB_004274 [Seison nebaliae]|nr:hypothetical protein SNEBB_004274 [Seison nebaliae]
MATKAYVGVYNKTGLLNENSIEMPGVFKTPIRTDIVQFVHWEVMKNTRQPYAVSKKAGHQTSAESWGTGRAVARIPRVRGGGTHRSGQAAYGNMCRGGRMFAPTRTWRRWHRRINVDQRRHAITSAISASAVPSLVLAKGHRIEKIPEMPLVVDNSVEEMTKTKEAVQLLRKLQAFRDVKRAILTKRMRPGKGKYRNRRWLMKKGPLVVYEKNSGIVKAFRNIPGVSVISVDRLNILKLAPGGHVGRFVIWTENAAKKLDELYGTPKENTSQKKNYKLIRPKMDCTDLSKLLNSDEIQSVLRAPIRIQKRKVAKRNPLKKKNILYKLNPHAETVVKQKKSIFST